MEVRKAILTRRSIRKFKSDPIPKEIIVKLLEAANLAPTAGNKQTWEFVVVGRNYLDRMQGIMESSFEARLKVVSEEAWRESIKNLPIPTDASKDKVKGLRQFYKSLGGAPMAIVVSVSRNEDPWIMRNGIEEASAAIENLILAAWDNGLGTCWMTGPLQRKEDEIREFLGIRDDREIIAIIPVGIPDHQPSKPPKIDAKTKTRWLE